MSLNKEMLEELFSRFDPEIDQEPDENGVYWLGGDQDYDECEHKYAGKAAEEERAEVCEVLERYGCEIVDLDSDHDSYSVGFKVKQ